MRRLVVIMFVGAAIYGLGRCVSYLFSFGILIDNQFPADRGLPSGIYARPLELHRGTSILAPDLELELKLLQYRKRDTIDTSGSFTRTGDHFTLFTRAFQLENVKIHPQKIGVTIEKSQIKSLINLSTGKSLNRIRLEPLRLGSLFPLKHVYQEFIKLEEVPPLLTRTLIAVEDQNFYTHNGIDFRAIMRAMLSNIRKGHISQGGSTITQQLARHLFFSREQTIRRKIDETIMAAILEFSFSKREILEAYINEVYLGQDGKRPIKGFSEGSTHYFGRDIRDLNFKEIALLVGMLKGPSYYNPISSPERAARRRNIVLEVMARQQLISYYQAEQASIEPIDIHEKETLIQFPAFVDLVRRRFFSLYPEKKIADSKWRDQGLRVFTTCDPIIQLKAEKSVTTGLDSVEAQHRLKKGGLETGAVVVSVKECNVLAVVGGRDPRFEGFNRAIDAKRPIGSLIKPAYFLAALEQPEFYNLMTLLDNSVLLMDQGNGRKWAPRNYGSGSSGKVPLYRALSQSFNTASVRLGMALGLDNCMGSVRKLGFEGEMLQYPAVLLGSVSMSPVEVAGMYHTIAAGGLNSPLRLIRSIYDTDCKLIDNFPLTSQRNFNQAPVFLLNVILQKAVTEGTIGKKNRQTQHLDAAGKTGTSDDFRDSWFAGFTGDKLAVVWVGKDDFGSGTLSGSEGAFKIWDEIMSDISQIPLRLRIPQDIELVNIDPKTGFKIEEQDCETAMRIPYISGFVPKTTITCQDAKQYDKHQRPFKKWFDGLFY